MLSKTPTQQVYRPDTWTTLRAYYIMAKSTYRIILNLSHFA